MMQGRLNEYCRSKINDSFGAVNTLTPRKKDHG